MIMASRFPLVEFRARADADVAKQVRRYTTASSSGKGLMREITNVKRLAC
jgi:hypothetical protein